MIVSFRDAWLRDFFVSDIRAKKIPADLQARLSGAMLRPTPR